MIKIYRIAESRAEARRRSGNLELRISEFLRSDGLNSHREGAIQSQTNRQVCLTVRMDQNRQLVSPSSALSSAVNPENFVNPVILSKLSEQRVRRPTPYLAPFFSVPLSLRERPD